MVWMGQHCYGERGVGDQELTVPLFHGLEGDLAEDTAEAGVSLSKRETIAGEARRGKGEPLDEMWHAMVPHGAWRQWDAFIIVI